MTDTVARLMKIADRYALANALGDSANDERFRQALQEELTRLFTPVEASEITEHIRGMDVDTREDLCSFSFRTGVRWAEEAHGIGGKS